MKTLKLLIIGFLLLNQTGIGQPTELIRFKFDFDKIGPLKLSEIVTEIKYIPLESKPECLIGYMNIPVYGKNIIIRSNTGAINGAVGTYRFSDKGIFLNQIGKIGRGPEEYQDNNDVYLSDDTVYIVSTFTSDVLCYSLSGTFLKKYHPDSDARPKNIVKLQDKSFMISMYSSDKNGALIKTDGNFKTKTGFIKNVPVKDNPFSYSFERSKNKIYYYHTYIDTIFEISKGYPVPEIIINYGNYKLSRDTRSINQKNNDVLNKPRIYVFNACDTYLKLDSYYPFKESSYTILYRITDGKQIVWSDLVNDIDNGTLDKWPGFLADNSLIFHLMPTTILDRYSKMTKAEKLNPKNSTFIRMASEIKPESNPVIMVCKLK